MTTRLMSATLATYPAAQHTTNSDVDKVHFSTLDQHSNESTEPAVTMAVSQIPEIVQGDNRLPVDVYQDWMTAIVSDNAELVENTLITADKNRRQLLLNGSFDYQDEDLIRHNQYSFGRPNTPLALCTLSAALRVMRVLVTHGANMMSVNDLGHNLVHQLIFVAFFAEMYETHAVKSYHELMRLADLQTKRKLLLTGSNIGLRPLEAAAQHGALHFVQAIIETDGVYLSRHVVRGLSVYQWFDITEYESCCADNRRLLSPVHFLMALDKNKLTHSLANQVFFDEPFGTWMNAKTEINKPLVFVWSLMRIVHLSAYYALDIHTAGHSASIAMNANATYTEAIPASSEYRYCDFDSILLLSKTTVRAIAIYIIVHSTLILLLDIYEYVNYVLHPCYTNFYKTIDDKYKAVFACSLYYVRSQRILASTLLVYGVLKLNDVSGAPLNFIRLVCMMLSTWSLLYFVQLMPSIGYFVVAIQRMVRQMFNFAGVYALFFFTAFSAFFVTVNTSERTSCSGEFSNLGLGLYSTFSVMLNLLNPVELRLRYPGWIYMMHVVYMFIVAILLINFLIAIMSSAMSEVAELRPIIARLQRLSVALAVEGRVGRILAPYYRAMKRRHFVYENDRVYIVRATRPCKYAANILGRT